MYGNISVPAMENYRPRVRPVLGFAPGANSRRASFTNPSRSATSQWGWGFYTMRAGVDRVGVTVFVPGMLGL